MVNQVDINALYIAFSHLNYVFGLNILCVLQYQQYHPLSDKDLTSGVDHYYEDLKNNFLWL